MKRQFLLLAYALRRIRVLVMTTGLLLAAFQIVLIVVARSIAKSGGFEQLSNLLPPFARELLGPSLAAFMSFAGIVCVGYIDLGVLGALVAVAVALGTAPTAEIEIGFIDLILARPLPRHWIVTRTILVMLLSTVVLLTMMMTGTWIGLETLAPRTIAWPAAKLIVSLAANLGLLMLSWGAVATAIGAASRRRSFAGALVGFLAVTAYLLDYVGRLWHPAEKVAWLSPFHYYNPFELIMGNPLPMNHVLVLCAIAAAGFITGYALFARRDISH